MAHHTHKFHNKSGRRHYSRKYGKNGRSMKRKLYSYYKKQVKSLSVKGKKKGG